MHRVGRLPKAGNDLARRRFDAPAILRQPVGVLPTAQRFRQPRAQRLLLISSGLMRLDDLLLASFEGPVEVGCNGNIFRYEAGRAEGLFQFGREIDKYYLRLAFGGRLLDLLEAVRGGRINSCDQAKVEYQVATFRVFYQQNLDVLIKPVGRAEEQITLKRHALNFPAV